MNIKPIGERLVLKSVKKETKTTSGIIIPDSEQQKPDYAEVIALSKEVEDKSIIFVGDNVIYSKYKGTTIKDKDDEYIVIELEDILAVIEK